MDNTLDESALIQSTMLGELDAFNQLVLAHQDGLYRWVFSLARDEVLAADITQAAFIRAYEKLSAFRDGFFRSWLFKIARNLYYDELRRMKRHPWLSLEGPSNDPDSRGFMALITNQEPWPEELIQEAELADQTARLLEQIPEMHQQVLRLVDMEGMDYQEAADVLSIPLGTLKSRLARARLKARRLVLKREADYEEQFSLLPRFSYGPDRSQTRRGSSLRRASGRPDRCLRDPADGAP